MHHVPFTEKRMDSSMCCGAKARYRIFTTMKSIALLSMASRHRPPHWSPWWSLANTVSNVLKNLDWTPMSVITIAFAPWMSMEWSDRFPASSPLGHANLFRKNHDVPCWYNLFLNSYLLPIQIKYYENTYSSCNHRNFQRSDASG